MSDFELPKELQTNKKAKAAVSAPAPAIRETELPKELDFPYGAAQDKVSEETSPSSAVEKPKYDEDELNKIFDEIMFTNEYRETVKIRGKLVVVFKTRNAEQAEALTRKLDSTSANLVSTLSEKRSLLTLQDALVEYQGRDLTNVKDEDKAKFISRLPVPVVGALLRALQKFDEKVFEACRLGEENF